VQLPLPQVIYSLLSNWSKICQLSKTKKSFIHKSKTVDMNKLF
jgi:hypothetical protein